MERHQTTIRDAALKDYPDICRLFAEANAEHCQMRPDLYRPVDVVIPRMKYNLAILLRDIFDYQPVSIQVAEQQNKIIGAVFTQSLSRGALSWSRFAKEAYVDNIVVDKDFRQQDVGSALLGATQDWAKKTGHTHMWGKIICENQASLALFEKAGFKNDHLDVGMHLS